MAENNHDWMAKYIEGLEKKIDSIDEKVEMLVQFKWRVVSFGVFVSVLCAAAFEIALKIIEIKFK